MFSYSPLYMHSLTISGFEILGKLVTATASAVASLPEVRRVWFIV